MLIFVLNDLHELRDDEHEGRLTVEKGTRHAGPPADLTVDTLDGVVGADAVPVLAGKTVYAKVSEKSPRATPATSTKRIPLSSLTTASVLNSAAARARAAPQAYVIDAGIGIDTPGGRLRRSSTKANALSFGVTMGSAMADLNMLLASTT